MRDRWIRFIAVYEVVAVVRQLEEIHRRPSNRKDKRIVWWAPRDHFRHAKARSRWHIERSVRLCHRQDQGIEGRRIHHRGEIGGKAGRLIDQFAQSAARRIGPAREHLGVRRVLLHLAREGYIQFGAALSHPVQETVIGESGQCKQVARRNVVSTPNPRHIEFEPVIDQTGWKLEAWAF